MTTPDPITTAREALKGIKFWTANQSTHSRPEQFAGPFEDITAAFDYAEKLKAERDEALTAHEDRGFDCERLRQDNTRLTSQLDLACRSLQRHVTNENSFDAANALDGIQNLKDRQAKGEG